MLDEGELMVAPRMGALRGQKYVSEPVKKMQQKSPDVRETVLVRRSVPTSEAFESS
jgi:hypothetical protein